MKPFEIQSMMTAAAWKACSCPVHQCLLYRGTTGWICPNGFGCTGIISNELLLERVFACLPQDAVDSVGIRERKAILREISRLSISDHTKRG